MSGIRHGRKYILQSGPEPTWREHVDRCTTMINTDIIVTGIVKVMIALNASETLSDTMRHCLPKNSHDGTDTLYNFFSIL